MNPVHKSKSFDPLQDIAHAFESAQIGLALLDREKKFLSMNSVYETMLGFGPQELIGASWRDTIHPDDHPRMAETYENAESQGRSYREIRGRCKDGTILYQAVRVTRYRTTNFDGFFCVRYDITTYKKDQEALALAVESAPSALLMLDSRGQITMANAAVEQLFGYKRQELLGQKVEMLLPERLRQQHATYRQDFGKNAMAGRDLVGRCKDGQEIPLQIYLNTIETPTGKLILCTILDIAERKRYQKQLELAKQQAEMANHAKSDFLARMSHEIRTPMNLIMGMNALLLESDLSSKQRQQVEVSHRNLRRLLRLINGILDLSKVEAGRLSLETVPFDLNRVLDETVATVADHAEQKGLRLSCRTQPGLWQWLSGDPERLQQVLLNLLGNAIKFTVEGDVSLEVRRENQEAGAESLHFEITDTGCGIPPGKEEIIFEAFQQAEGGVTRRFGGTGLGLTIARTLVEKMSGRIWVEPKEGPGSKFVFTARFPHATPQDVATRSQEVRRAQARKGVKRGTKILVAEDNEENVFLLQTYLEGEPLTIKVAPDGESAVRMRKEDDYDLILMDIQMPRMDGYSATREIRNWETSHQKERVPIVALTAHALLGAAAESKEAGCDGHVTKPIQKDELLEAIGRYALETPLEKTREIAISSSVRAMQPRYLSKRRADLKTMREAVEQNDFETVRRIGHDWKGTGMGYGFPEISALGAALEAAAKNKDILAIEQHLGNISLPSLAE